MRRVLRFVSATAFIAVLVSGTANAATIQLLLGDQDFVSGVILDVPGFDAASTGEDAPFDAFRPGDTFGNPSFSESFTFTYSAIVDTILSASLEIGIYDHDSMATGSQVQSFLMDLDDLTVDLDNQFENSGGASNEYNVYALAIPIASLAKLLDGSVTFSLTLQGPGLGILGELPNNGAGLDFARLTIETMTTAPTPEPATALLLLLGVAGVCAARRKRS